MLDWIARQLNHINDLDLTWVGFRALRPAVDQDMSPGVVVRFCLVYCPLSALLAYLVARVVIPAYTARPPSSLPWVFAACAAALYAILQSVLAAYWNRRARRLREERKGLR